MALRDIILAKIKEEITNDPEGVGYVMMSNAEKLAAINNAVRKNRIVEDVYPAPINRILAGIPETPNMVALQDLVDALT